MPFKKLLAGVFLFIGFSATSLGYDPNSQSVEEALRSAKATFIGRVIELKEKDHQRDTSSANASFLVVTPLYGTGIKAGTKLNVLHKTRYYTEKPQPGYSIHFKMSHYYLVTLKNDAVNKDRAYEFHSYAGDQSDIAFLVTDYDGSKHFTSNRTEHYYESIYEPGSGQQLELNKLVRWVAK